MAGSFFNPLDYFYISLILISCIVGFFRGFVKDFFSTCSWLGSGSATAFILPYLSEYIQKTGMIKNPTYSKIAAAILSFVVVMIVLRLIINAISKTVKGTVLSSLDRAFGALYGFIRGFLILIVICICAIMFDMLDMKSELIVNSKTTPMLLDVTDYLLPKIMSTQKISREFNQYKIDIDWLQEDSAHQTKRLSKGQIRRNRENPNKQTENKGGGNFLNDLVSKFFDKGNNTEGAPQVQPSRKPSKVKNKENNEQRGYVDLIKARAKEKAQKKAERIRRDLMKSLDNNPR